mgnify:CR=1 FL=1
MTVAAALASGDIAPPPDASAIPAFLFPTETGLAGAYQFSPGDDVHASLGSSLGAEGVGWFLRNAKQPCVVGVCEATPGTKSAIVHTGSGPTVTAGYAGSLTGPLLSLIISMKVLVGGLKPTRDFSDVLAWVLPGVVRVFTASDRMVQYDKVREENDDWSEDAWTFENKQLWIDVYGEVRERFARK